jgi:hypothetical protein
MYEMSRDGFTFLAMGFRLLNFQESSYPNEQNRIMPTIEMTRDGFTFLAMGFTGAKANRGQSTKTTLLLLLSVLVLPAPQAFERNLALSFPTTGQLRNVYFPPTVPAIVEQSQKPYPQGSVAVTSKMAIWGLKRAVRLYGERNHGPGREMRPGARFGGVRCREPRPPTC